MSGKRKSPKNLKMEVVVESDVTTETVLRGLVDRYHAARERVGDHPPEQLNWLVSQVQRDPEELRKALRPEYSDFRMELAWFGHASNPWETGDEDEILEAFAELRGTFRNLRPDWQAELTFPTKGKITRNFTVMPATRRMRWAGAIESFYSSDRFPTAFLLAAADVIQEEGLRVRECARPECRRPFVKRKRGIFCSTSCSQKVRDKRFRERHSAEELRERRHQQYVSSVKRSRGSAVASKVSPRRPTKEKP